jgi:hypothetical protein
MPTSQEYRQQADECLEIVNEAKEWYVRMALLQLAVEFKIKSRELGAARGCPKQALPRRELPRDSLSTRTCVLPRNKKPRACGARRGLPVIRGTGSSPLI